MGDVAVHFWVQMTCSKVLNCVGVIKLVLFLAIFMFPISACISLNEECGGSIVWLEMPAHVYWLRPHCCNVTCSTLHRFTNICP